MALEGTLKDFSPCDIMELIDSKRKTGLLFVTSPEGETITLGFEREGLVLAHSSAKHHDMQIGNILTRSGRITEVQRDKALSLQKGTLDPIGYILRREKFCTQAGICAGLHIQIKRVFFALLHWHEGTYIFEPQESIDYFHEFVKPVDVKPLNVQGLMMEGAVMIDEWPMIEKVVPSLEMVFRQSSRANEVTAISIDDEFDFEGEDTKKNAGIQVTAEEDEVYHLVDGKHCVGDILEQTIHSEFFCCKLVFQLVKKNLIEVVEIRPSVPESKGDEKPSVKPPKEDHEKWNAARALLQRVLPEAIVFELVISKKKATPIQGASSVGLWINPVLSLFETVAQLEKKNQVGAFESLGNNAGVALFWDHRRDYMLVVVEALAGSGAASRFRSQVATVTRCIL